jgi:glutaredoxin 2
MSTDLTPEQITQALIEEAKREMAEEETRQKKAKIKGMLTLIADKEQVIKEVQKSIDQLKKELAEGNFRSIENDIFLG